MRVQTRGDLIVTATCTVTWYPIQPHYPDIELTSVFPILLVSIARLGSNKWQFYKSSVWLKRELNSQPSAREACTLPFRPLRPVHAALVYVIISNFTVNCGTTPDFTITCCTIPDFTITCYTIPDIAINCCSISIPDITFNCCSIPDFTITSYTIPDITINCCTMPDFTINSVLCQILQLSLYYTRLYNYLLYYTRHYN